MRIQIRIALVLLFATALLAASSLHPQTVGSATHTNSNRPELAADFSYLNSNAAAAPAVDLGGGLDLTLNRSFRVRLAQASYLLTTFDNGSNGRQNSLRLSAGLAFRF